MPSARLALVTLSLGLFVVAGCTNENKPAATTPAPASAKADDPAKPAEGVKPVIATAHGDKVKVVDGPAPSADDRYQLQIDHPADAAAGKESEVVVRVVPKAPWHINLDFPTSLKLVPPAGLVLASKELKKADARKLDDEHCEFAVKVTPSGPGDHAVTGELKFAVCQDEACSPVTEEVEFRVAVK